MVVSKEVKRVLENPSLLQEKEVWTNQKLVLVHDWIHSLTNLESKDLTVTQYEEVHELIAKEFFRRGIEGVHQSPIQGTLQGSLTSLEEILPYLKSFKLREKSPETRNELDIFLAGKLVNEELLSGKIDIFVEACHKDARIEKEIKNLFLNPSPPLPSRPDLAQRIKVNFGGLPLGYSIKIYEPHFRSLGVYSYLTQLEHFRGSSFSLEEKKDRLKSLKKEIEKGWVDKEMIPFLEKINAFPFVMTTQSCCGHEEDVKKGRHAHIDFRSALSIEETVNRILRPFMNEFINSGVELMVESGSLRYVLWLDNKEWTSQLNDFIEALKEVYESPWTLEYQVVNIEEASSLESSGRVEVHEKPIIFKPTINVTSPKVELKPIFDVHVSQPDVKVKVNVPPIKVPPATVVLNRAKKVKVTKKTTLDEKTLVQTEEGVEEVIE